MTINLGAADPRVLEGRFRLTEVLKEGHGIQTSRGADLESAGASVVIKVATASRLGRHALQGGWSTKPGSCRG